ncbi:COG3650 family protein [Vibrio furnissii]|uniref:COG3650 family protein n=1 Tax=Vibrio furnissii TaxID=29494 RepID=UPI003AA7AC53
MKALRTPAAILTALALQACSSTPGPQPTPAEPPKASLDQPASIQPQPFVVRGQVVIGPEVRSLTPCGSNQQLLLDLSPTQVKQATDLAHSPYQIMYGEVIGHLAPPSKTGYNGDYAARFVVDQVNMLSAENPQRCNLAATPTRAFGTEPFWSMNYTADGLTFQPLGGPKQTFAIDSSRLSANQRVYRFEDGELTLTREACADGMSDTLYGWRSELSLKGGDYQGCATLGNSDPTLEWVGTYFASSTQTTGFSVTLNLDADHMATTRYHYSSGEADIVERGYWQQLNPRQIQVVMTQHQQQYLVSERVFTREGSTLSAEKEKVGDVVYPIANGGLVLFSARQASSPAASPAPLSDHQIASRDDYEEDVDQALRRYFALHHTAPDNTQYRWLKYDLTGDNQPELLVQLDWCGSGGCTLLVFQQQNQEWRFNSRITLVRTPFQLGKHNTHGWQDLMLPVSGGGAQAATHRLQYNGISYPVNPSVADVAQSEEISGVTLFADGLSPKQAGVKL